MGLTALRDETQSGKWGLEVTMTDWDDKKYFAFYKSFKVCDVFHLKVEYQI